MSITPLSLNVGIIAGTPIDTQMGVDFLQHNGIDAFGIPAAQTPQEQTNLQVLAPDKLTEIVLSIINQLKRQGANHILIYCNSLSSAINLNQVRSNTKLPVVTPHDVYRNLTHDYRKIGIIAANGQSLAGIEHTFQCNNPNCIVIGAAMLPVVIAIEAGIPPSAIVETLGLKKVIGGIIQAGAEALVLGCTHLPYVAACVRKICPVTVIDPNDEMLHLLASQSTQI